MEVRIMATRKRSTPPESDLAPIPTANIPRDAKTLAKIGEGTLDALAEYEQAHAAQEASQVIAKASKRPKHTRRDIKAVNSRLHDVALNLTAIHDLCGSAMELCGAGEAESILLLMREAARSSARAVDICNRRLGNIAIGCFDDDLASD
jgi:hypothetical protein